MIATQVRNLSQGRTPNPLVGSIPHICINIGKKTHQDIFLFQIILSLKHNNRDNLV